MANPHPGPSVPHRTPRKRALEIGTDPRGFDGGEGAYPKQAGPQPGAGPLGTDYKDNTAGAEPRQGQPPATIPVPFKLR